MKVQVRRLVAAGLIYTVGVVTVALASYVLEHQRFMDDIDSRLLAAASNLPSLLPEDFHDIARTKDAISPEQDRHNLELLSSHARSGDLTYIYSYVMVDGEIRFTSCNYTEDDVKNNQVVTYWTGYPEGAQKYYDAMTATEPVYVTAGDRWGLFRTILMPLKSPSGQPYVAAADMDITVIEELLLRNILSVLGLCLLLIFIVVPLVWAYNRTYSEMNGELRNLNGKLQEDIDQAKVLEAELKQATQQAENANKIKSQFLSNMSHELRTPINGIVGMNHLLMDTPLNQEQQEFVGMCNKSAHVLLDTVNQILDTAAIEANGMVLLPQVIETQAFFDSLIKMFSAQVAEKELDLVLNLSNDLPVSLSVDDVRLRQVFINLLANAIKFTDSGKVQLDVRWLKGELHATVTDTGIGIPEHAQKTIFDIFQQVDSSKTREHDGSGLGLAIAQKICQLMAGSLQLERSSDSGTVFTLQVAAPAESTHFLKMIPSKHMLKVAAWIESATLQGWLKTELSSAVSIVDSTEQISEAAFATVIYDFDIGTSALDRLLKHAEGKNLRIICLLWPGQKMGELYHAKVSVLRKPLVRSELASIIMPKRMGTGR